MTTYTTLTIPAAQYADSDDCLAAAADDVAQEHGVPAGYDMAPRWADDDRDEILVDVPAREEHTPADAVALCRELHVRLVASDIDPGCVSSEPVPPRAARLLRERLDAIGVLSSDAPHEDRDGNRDGRVWVYVAIDPESL